MTPPECSPHTGSIEGECGRESGGRGGGMIEEEGERERKRES